jgi:hypothetical protein
LKAITSIALTRAYEGGSAWDICFGLCVGYSTLHVKKYEVIHAINDVLRDNIMFPTTEAKLQHLADGFAKVGAGKGAGIPNVVLAVDSVVVPRKAPIASKEKNISGQYCRKRLLRDNDAGFCGRLLTHSFSFREMCVVLARFDVVCLLRPWQEGAIWSAWRQTGYRWRRCIHLHWKHYHSIQRTHSQCASAQLQLLLFFVEAGC